MTLAPRIAKVTNHGFGTARRHATGNSQARSVRAANQVRPTARTSRTASGG
jgi:hypothetical protein